MATRCASPTICLEKLIRDVWGDESKLLPEVDLRTDPKRKPALEWKLGIGGRRYCR
jgi:hypothetical protein